MKRSYICKFIFAAMLILCRLLGRNEDVFAHYSQKTLTQYNHKDHEGLKSYSAAENTERL